MANLQTPHDAWELGIVFLCARYEVRQATPGQELCDDHEGPAEGDSPQKLHRVGVVHLLQDVQLGPEVAQGHLIRDSQHLQPATSRTCSTMSDSMPQFMLG